jgi:hypothetical protein
MLRSSFRWLVRRFVPGRNRCKQAILAAFALVVAGCGSGDRTSPLKNVQGTGYTFSAPASWEIVRTARQVQAVEGKKSFALVAVSRLPLLHVFRAELWSKVVPELDRVADGVAQQQHGSVTEAKDVKISGEPARKYLVAYDLRGKKLVETIAFVLRGKTEYELLCRYAQDGSSDACDTLLETFTLVG